ncbi:14802_t:CDS:2 [Funneliformis geosporum]|uniref:18389_t:CDS:1 n=1 Tax=Funneliformis geosporum TaxID=1117311 RepID=A0A9W4T2K9_9GLOM|nr:14802_t:CDS:2 [Funneliformis geosporum]CAI2190627.1 18389_t:CDS:2 [Funneliformis geosporum]
MNNLLFARLPLRRAPLLARNFSRSKTIEKSMVKKSDRHDIISLQEEILKKIDEKFINLYNRKEIERVEEKMVLVKQNCEIQRDLLSRTQKLLQIKNLINVLGVLEFIRSQILPLSIKKRSFSEPNDKALKILSHNEKFIKELTHACEANSLRYNDVRRSLGGLYHAASKNFHGHEKDIVIDSRSFTKNEVFVLGVLFRYFNIPYDYCNEDGDLVEYPYKV